MASARRWQSCLKLDTAGSSQLKWTYLRIWLSPYLKRGSNQYALVVREKSAKLCDHQYQWRSRRRTKGLHAGAEHGRTVTHRRGPKLELSVRMKGHPRRNTTNYLPAPIPITLCHTAGRSIGNEVVTLNKEGQVKSKMGFQFWPCFF